MNNTIQFLIGFIGIIMIGYLFVAVFQCKSVNKFQDTNHGVVLSPVPESVVQPLVPESVVLAPVPESVVQPLVPKSVVLAPVPKSVVPAPLPESVVQPLVPESVVQPSENEPEVVQPLVPESVVLPSNKSSSNNNLQGSPTDAKEDIMFSEKQVTSIFKTQFNYGNLIYFTN